MIKNACKDCTSRHVGCHSTCSNYKQYRQDIDKAKKEENIYTTINGLGIESNRRKWLSRR